MDLYITVVFWFSMFGLVFRILNLCMEHPRKESTNVGQDAATLILSIAAFVWVCCLKFGAIS